MFIKFLKSECLHKCDNCGKEFKGIATRRFCSQSCSNTTQKTQMEVFSDEERNRRRRACRTSYRERHPNRDKVHNMMVAAIKQGKLIQEDICEICGQEDNVEAHHQNYDKPLKVNWLCSSCHHRVHSTVRELEKIMV